MATTTILTNNFSQGEVSDKLRARADTLAYQHGCRTLTNFIPMASGGVRRRPGSYDIGATRDDARARLISFRGKFNTYVMELTENHARFWTPDHTLLQAGDSEVDLATPWDAAQMPDVQHASVDNVLYCVQESSTPRALIEAASGSLNLFEPTFYGERVWRTITNTYSGIAWSPELHLFVAVGEESTDPVFPTKGRVATSTDGLTWVRRNAASTVNWTSVCWSPTLGIFVAVGYGGTATARAMTSPDGITWTAQTTPSDNNNWYDVCWSPDLSLFVAVANAGTTNRVMTSPDGITWTARATPGTHSWKSVCWSPELSLFVAVSNSALSNYAMTSPDGITWTLRSTPPSGYPVWHDVCWSPELSLFVAVGEATGTHCVMTSTDGINWTDRDTPSADIVWRSVCWSPELSLFVAVGSPVGTTSYRVMTSPDGITWTLRSTPSSGSPEWNAVCWSSEWSLFVAVAYAGSAAPYFMTSADGIEWSIIPDPYPRVCASNGGRLVLGSTIAEPALIAQSRAPDVGGYRATDFTAGTNPDDAIFTFQNDEAGSRLVWVFAKKRMTAGSDCTTWIDSGQIPTPGTFYMVPGEAVNCPPIQPCAIGDAIFYIGGPSPSLHMLSYSEEGGGLVDVDLTEAHDHILKPGVVEIAAMVSPEKIIWIVRSDGKLVSCTLRHGGFGFAVHEIAGGGLVESACVLRTSTGDELWLSVNRDGKRRICYLTIEDDDDQSELHYVDDGIRFYSSTPTTTVTGLDHLEGVQVYGLADGLPFGPKTVSEGEITLDTAASIVHVGRRFNSVLRTNRPEVGVNQTWQGKKKQIEKLMLPVYKSRGGKVGEELGTLYAVSDIIRDNPGYATVNLKTEDWDLDFSGFANTDGSLYVVSDDVWPLTPLATVMKFKILEN